MDYSLLIPSFLLSLLGLYLIVIIVVPISRNLYFTISLKRARELRRVRKCQKRLAQARDFFKEGQFKAGLQLVTESFYLELIEMNEYLLPRIHEHNLALLAEVVRAGDGAHGSLKAIPMLESLLEERAKLQRLHFDTKTSLQSLKRNKKKGDRAWADKEFSTKQQNTRKELKQNRRSIQTAINQLLESSPQYAEADTSTTYH